MKKKYIAPSMMAIRVSTVTVLAGSITGTNVEGLDDGGNSSNAGITTGGSRRSTFWDYEE